MSLIQRQLLTVTRYTGGTYSDGGEWVEGTPADIPNFRASKQPLSARQLQSLPEGRRASGESYRLYADPTPELNISTDESPDFVEIDGEDYEVFLRDRWDNNLINHRKYIVIRKATK